MEPIGNMWTRFWSLPWRLKGPALAAVMVVPLAIAAVVLAVGGSDEAGVESTAGPTGVARPTVAPAPTAAPTATEPAPPTPAEQAYRLVRAVEAAEFDRMLGFALIPGATGEAVVVTQGGVIWRVSLSGGSAPTVFGDISGLLIDDPGNEEGLLGLAFSPSYSTDGRVYLYYTVGNPRRSFLSRFSVIDGSMDVAGERVLEIEEPFQRHNGGQLAFGPDGYLYIAVGDGGAGGDPQGNGQNLGTLLGTILRLDVSGDGYEVPPDNPFVGTAGARGEIYAYGLRNPWRFSFDQEMGELWAGDVGQNDWEEVDRIVSGGNYGWNTVEGFECFQAATCDTGGLEPPRAVYGHELGCSVTGGIVYRGESMPELAGWYVYGDFCTGNIWAVNTADDSPPVLLAATDQPIASFGELPDGELLAVTFANAIFRLERTP